MANNRLYIRCKRCGEYLLIGKHFGYAYYAPDDIDDTLSEFYMEHAFCGEKRDDFADRGDFEIAYESAPNNDTKREIGNAHTESTNENQV